MIRITWALVVLGGALLIGGFFMSDQNILLILAIAVELAAIILVLASWARRAKDAADAYDEDLSFGTVDDDTAGDEEDEELFETFADEEFVVGGRSTRKPARKSARKSKPAARSKSKPAARKAKTAARKTTATKKSPARKSAAKPKATAKSGAKSGGKSTAKSGAKKTTARKSTKSKPQRRKPSTG